MFELLPVGDPLKSSLIQQRGAACLEDRSEVGQGLLLVVEDDPNDYALLDRALRKARVSARVQWVQSAAEAVATLARMQPYSQPICVVADVKLRGTDGFELVEQLRKSAGCDHLKFAFLTGRHDPVTHDRANACGADAFFVKPTQSDDLVEIARALQRLVAGHS